MKETVKNYVAMVIATIIWVLGFSILAASFYLIESGPAIEELIFLGVVIALFVVGIYLSNKSERLKAALEFPLFPNS